jgi:hypothetical protein
MEQSSIEKLILGHLYQAWFLPDIDDDLRNLLPQEIRNETPVSNLVNRLSHDRLIFGWRGGITPLGIFYAENNGFAPEELKRRNEHVRVLLLDALAKVHEEQGNLYTASIDDLAHQSGLENKLVVDNLRVLEGLGQVEFKGNARFKITYNGLNTVEGIKRRRVISEEFESISKMSPQPRGRALQKLLAKLLGQQGWNEEESVRTSNEEIDVIISREREFYLLECKWEKNPIQANVIRELFGKLSNRFDVRGITVSMSGFTEGSIKQASDYIGQRVILLFGPEDVRSIVSGQATFDELLNAKYKEVVTRRKIAFN